MIKHQLPQVALRVNDNERYGAMLEWVASLDGAIAALAGAKMPPTPLAADASNRRFFRIATATDSLILVDAPPNTEANDDYLTLSGWYRSHGFQVPEVYAHDLAAGYFLVSDLGAKTYLDVLEQQPEQAEGLYNTAITTLLRLAATPPDALPAYTEARFAGELDLFATWFAGAWFEQPLPACWEQLKVELLEAVTVQPEISVHRDFHSRNLIVADAAITITDKNVALEPGIVDYQDSLKGPLCYDIASLLWDCYIDWPEADNLARLHAYRGGLPDSLATKLSATDFERLALLTASQRHLKALGIFARLHVQDGRSQYLASMPRVLAYLALHLRQSAPEFSDWLDTSIKPQVLSVLAALRS